MSKATREVQLDLFGDELSEHGKREYRAHMAELVRLNSQRAFATVTIRKMLNELGPKGSSEELVSAMRKREVLASQIKRQRKKCRELRNLLKQHLQSVRHG